jgi:hypothetical protein
VGTLSKDCQQVVNSFETIGFRRSIRLITEGACARDRGEFGRLRTLACGSELHSGAGPLELPGSAPELFTRR